MPKHDCKTFNVVEHYVTDGQQLTVKFFEVDKLASDFFPALKKAIF
jgi:hypothetical protein